MYSFWEDAIMKTSFQKYSIRLYPHYGSSQVILLSKWTFLFVMLKYLPKSKMVLNQVSLELNQTRN